MGQRAQQRGRRKAAPGIAYAAPRYFAGPRVNSNASGWRVAHAGGTRTNGSNAGLWYLNGNNTATNANAAIGGRLLVPTISIA